MSSRKRETRPVSSNRLDAEEIAKTPEYKAMLTDIIGMIRASGIQTVEKQRGVARILHKRSSPPINLRRRKKEAGHGG